MKLIPPPARGEPPFRWLFLDLNSYFASVEQQENPALRGKPVAVAPILAESGACIAASYPAKKFGIKTGTRVAEARQLCPGITIVGARPELYVDYHHRILRAVESVTPVHEVRSIDELSVKLCPSERDIDAAVKLGLAIKQAIHARVGPALTCSVGLGPNVFLAKIATDLHKPDGLTALPAEDIARRLYPLGLTDFPGISKNMERRFHMAGIETVEQMYAAPVEQLHAIWHSILGDRWYYLIRGYEVPVPATKRSSVGHSHVLPPQFRTPFGARAVLLRLIQKGAARLRAMGYRAGAMNIFIEARTRNWDRAARFDAAADPLTLIGEFQKLWNERRFTGQPVVVGMQLFELVEEKDVTPSLFDRPNNNQKLGLALDSINHRFGKNSVYIAASHSARDTAEEKIAFTKTELFNEGKKAG